MTSPACDVSIVISTYNRCDTLEGALQSVLGQDAGLVTYEIIVVDNNSTDRTREVVDAVSARGHGHLRYLFEGRQGLSHARNAGIAQARAPIIAFTDDDVRVASDWVVNIKRAFDAHPEVDYVGGRVLPRWPTAPPTWLTRDHWSPMALSDYGDAPMYVNAEAPVCLVGANLAFRRDVFARVGLFQPDFQRVKDGIGSTEDHELQLRLWHARRQGMYVPALVVTAEVEPRRMSKEYHRRWHTGHGHFYAGGRDRGVDGEVVRRPWPCLSTGDRRYGGVARARSARPPRSRLSVRDKAAVLRRVRAKASRRLSRRRWPWHPPRDRPLRPVARREGEGADQRPLIRPAGRGCRFGPWPFDPSVERGGQLMACLVWGSPVREGEAMGAKSEAVES
jgi:glucosyl-dolichyl phosphate glucuronosyltransferase